MQSKSHIQQLLNQAGIRPNKRFGQNFLIDLNLMTLFVEAAGIQDNDIVLEIGTGTGSLTEELVKRAAAVISIEVDSNLYPIAQQQLSQAENLTLICGDILTTKHILNKDVIAEIGTRRETFDGRFLLVGNLPYQAGTPAMINLVTGRPRVDAMMVTVQKEVALRMIAEPNHHEYGLLSIVLHATGRVRIERMLKPSVFWPSPQVESAMVRFDIDEQKYAAIKDMNIFMQLVSQFMQHRRKTLKSCARLLKEPFHKIGDFGAFFEKAGIDPILRPQNISPQQYVQLANSRPL